jgi:hypothetical protein
MTYTVHTANETSVVSKLKRLAKKAVKFGLTPITWTKGEEYPVKHEINCGCCFGNRVDILVDYTVTGAKQEVKREGWTLVGALDFISAQTPIVASLSNEHTIPKKFREASMLDCDHCKTSRRRKNLFILINDAGEYAQVGGTCVKDYLGQTANDFLVYSDIVFALANTGDDVEMGNRIMGSAYDLKAYLRAVSAVIKVYGWVSKSKAYEEGGISTADLTMTEIAKKESGNRDAMDLSGDSNLVTKAIEWVKANTQDTDYIYNLKAIVEAGYVTRKTLGFSASIVSSYQRHVEREAKAKVQTISEYFGEIKTRYKGINATFISSRWIESYYGSSELIKLRLEGGEMVTWFTSSEPNFEDGKTYNIDLTVKKHDEYKGAKQTLVTRVKINS